MRENEMTKKERTQGRHRLGRGKEGSASISSPVFFEKGGVRKRGRGRILGRGSAGVVPPDLDQSPLLFQVLFLFCLLSRTREVTSSVIPPSSDFPFTFPLVF